MKKGFALLIILILTAASLIMVKPAFAQSIPTPSVPQFTVKFVDLSYDAPTTTSIDPYTGQNITNQGHYVENRTIQITIKNQPFTSYIQNEENISFYLNVREKGHYEDNWTTLYTADNYYTSQSNGDYTTLTYSLDPNAPPWLYNNLPSGGQLGFQVEALVGHVSRTSGFASWYFDGEESGWSNTQTVTITTTLSTSPSPTPTVPEFPSTILIIIFLVTATLLGTVVIKRKQSRRG